MQLFHASTVVVDTPDVLHSRSFLDFGCGFHLTTIREQVVKYADRFLRRGKTAVVNSYDCPDDFAQYRPLRFERYDEAWLDFVTSCRTGNDDTSFDLVIGGIADDIVFRTVDLFYAGEITKEECLRRLVYEQPNCQICFRSQQAINDCLTFIEATEL